METTAGDEAVPRELVAVQALVNTLDLEDNADRLDSPDALRRFLADLHGLALGEFADHLYDYYEERAVQHLFAVAAGILVPGAALVYGLMPAGAATAGPLLTSSDAGSARQAP